MRKEIEMNPLVSVIVPVYNVEKYIHKCVDSLIHQTYKNIEIILVDDGSPDNCGSICDEYATKDSRIQVIHKKNGGLSDARNKGMEVAKGDLITFVDSDDYVRSDIYEKLVNMIVNEGCDVAECGVTKIYDGTINEPAKGNNEILTGQQVLTRYLRTDGTGIPITAVWSKLFKKEMLKGLTFPVGHIHEDYLLVTTVFYRAKKYGIVREGLYYHLDDNPTSITNAKFGKRDLYRFVQLGNIKDFIEKNGTEEQYKYAAANYYKGAVQYFYKCKYNHFEEADEYRDLLIRNHKDIKASTLDWKKRLEIFFIKNCPSLYLKIRKNVMSMR